MRTVLIPLAAGLVVGIIVTLALQTLLARVDPLGFGGPLFGLASWTCGVSVSLGVALTTWAMMRGGKRTAGQWALALAPAFISLSIGLCIAGWAAGVLWSEGLWL
jgi:hypothetical protein